MRNRKIHTNLSAAVLAGALALASLAPQTAFAENAGEEYREWESNTELSIAREGDLMREAGLSLDEWDEQTALMRETGLKNPLEEQDILLKDPQAEISRTQERIYAVKSSAFEPVRDAMDAYRTVYSLIGLLGGEEQTDLRLWSQMRMNDMTVYSFQEIQDSQTVPGSTVKLTVGPDGSVSAVFSALGKEETAEEEASLSGNTEAAEPETSPDGEPETAEQESSLSGNAETAEPETSPDGEPETAEQESSLSGNAEAAEPETSPDGELETADETIRVSRAEAEQSVREYLAGLDIEAEVSGDDTERVIHSLITLDMLRLDDPEEEDAEEEEEDSEEPPEQLLWAVYTPNSPEMAQKLVYNPLAGYEEIPDEFGTSRTFDEIGADPAEYPWVAHYVTEEGVYLYSLPVTAPGDGDSCMGYRRQPVFDGMVPGEWTGEIMNTAGDTRTVTLPVMQSEETGLWYLGDAERKIAIADFGDAVYTEDHPLNLVSSTENGNWDNEDLYMFYNYIRAWDFYADMGWMGPDGAGTEVIILKDICTEDGSFYENAASLGCVEGWQMFAYNGYSDSGLPLGLVQGLDVMAHEYTHTFTTTVMNTNLYLNDAGAINEAMSDIMGNLVEYICRDTEDTDWLLGENTGMVVRNMSDPRAVGQPAYVWDVFYGPHVDKGSEVNDNGGVHMNSSLLNRIAALLCLKYDMSFEEAASFWLMTAMGLTPQTDYVQIGTLLEWALQETGNTAYREGLLKLIDEEQLARTEVPDRIPMDQRYVRLQLPDTETFANDNWALLAFQVDMEVLSALAGGAIKIGLKAASGAEEMSEYIPVLEEVMENLRLDPHGISLDPLSGSEQSAEEQAGDMFYEVLSGALEKLILQSMSWKEAGTNEMPIILKDNPTLYVLLNMRDSGTKLNGMAVLFRGKWRDLSPLIGFINAMDEAEEGSEEETSAAETEMLEDGSEAGESEAEEAGTAVEAGETGAEEAGTAGEAEETGAEEADTSADAEGAETVTGETLEDASDLDQLLAEVRELLQEREENQKYDLPLPDLLFTKEAEAEYLPTKGLENIRLIEE